MGHYTNRIFKLSPDGQLLWTFQLNAFANDIPALMDGLLYSIETDGHVVAISMESGALVWRSPQVCTWKSQHPPKAHAECNCERIGPDIGAIAANKGIVTFKAYEPPGGGACKATGLNASTRS